MPPFGRCVNNLAELGRFLRVLSPAVQTLLPHSQLIIDGNLVNFRAAFGHLQQMAQNGSRSLHLGRLAQKQQAAVPRHQTHLQSTLQKQQQSLAPAQQSLQGPSRQRQAVAGFSRRLPQHFANQVGRIFSSGNFTGH